MMRRELLFLITITLSSTCLISAARKETGFLSPQENKDSGEKIPKRSGTMPDTDLPLDQKRSAHESSADGIIAPVLLKLNHIDFTQFPVVSQTNTQSFDSGYYALNNALLTLKGLQEAPHDREHMAARLKNEKEFATVFPTESGLWRKRAITWRKDELANNYIKDSITQAIKGAKKIGYQDITSFDFTPLYLEEAVVVFDKSVTSIEDTTTLVNLIPAVVKRLLTKKQSGKDQRYTFSRTEIIDAFQTEINASAQADGSSILAKRDVLELYFEKLQDCTFSIESSKNQNKLLVENSVIHTRTYEPSPEAQDSQDGDWLSEFEIKELANTVLHEFQHQLYIECVEFPLKNAAERVIHMRKTQALFAALDKNAHTKAVVFVSIDGHWFSCVLTHKKETSIDPLSKTAEIIKSKPRISMIVTDSKNQDRRVDSAIMNIIQLFENKEKKPEKEKPKDDFLNSLLDPKPDKEKKKTEDDKGGEKVNYDPPLLGYGLTDLPSLEDLFGGTVPNNIHMRVRQIKELTKEAQALDKRGKPGTIIKNCTLLYGPPGTGKSTIAYVMTLLAAEEAGHDIDIVYAGGGDFRDAYQGSGKAKLDALFNEAINRKNPCVIIIDEVDGTSAKLEPRQSTQEDNRAIKTLITTLDKYRYHPGIYIICTTNYPEKIEPAILRRFSSIEIPLPNYQMRKRILKYYLTVNDIEIKDHDPKAISESFLNSFVTATDGMSGDALADMVSNAAHEVGLGLKPEEKIGLSFRFKNIDLYNRSLVSNLPPLFALPFTPLAHMFNRFPNTDIEKHLYGQFLRHHKLKSDIDTQGRKKALEDYRAKQIPLLERWKKIAENSIISNVAATTVGVFIGAGIIWAAKKLYDKYDNTTGRKDNPHIPWVETTSTTPAAQPAQNGVQPPAPLPVYHHRLNPG